ncbi:MAG: hypothetical protein AAFP98_09390 [Pseudomonadota bacterium]
MYKTLTAGLTALSLILVPAAPVHAQTNQDEVGRTILGLLAVGGIALAMKNHQEQQKQARQRRQSQVQAPATPNTPVQEVHNQRNQNQGQHVTRGWGHQHNKGWNQQSRRQVDLVPGRCFRRVETANGRFQGVYGARCLERRYRDAHTLPRQCQVRVGGTNGSRRGYDARCLRDFGYRSDQIWN